MRAEARLTEKVKQKQKQKQMKKQEAERFVYSHARVCVYVTIF